MTVQEGRDRFVVVKLTPWLNNKCAGFPDGRDHINVTGLGGGFAAEHLPPPGGLYTCDGVPFLTPDFRGAANDNLALEGETIATPRGPCRRLHFWGFADLGPMGARITLVFSGGGRRGLGLEFSSWKAEAPERGERPGPWSPVTRTADRDVPQPLKTWVQSVPVDDDGDLVAIEVEDMSLLHVLALTLERPGRPAASGRWAP